MHSFMWSEVIYDYTPPRSSKVYVCLIRSVGGGVVFLGVPYYQMMPIILMLYS